MTQLADVTRTFAEKRGHLLQRLRKSPSGLRWCREQSELADDFLRDIFSAVAGDRSDLVCIIAIGGYGRRELAPYSDVDLLVVPRDDADPALEDMVRSLHRELHTAFIGAPQMALSYAFFLVNDAPALDPKTRTAMLDARLVCGSSEAYESFHDAFQGGFSAGEFLLEKIHEREAAHERWNDTPLAVEPHLKEGAGGLRSFQCANWIRQAIESPRLVDSPAYDQVAKTRNLLHLAAGSNLDRFTRPRQAEVADLAGQNIACLTSESGLARLELFEAYLASLSLVKTANYTIFEAVRAQNGEIDFSNGPSLSAAAFGAAVGSQLGLGAAPSAGEVSDEIDGPAALNAIGTGEKTIRALDRSGLLERLLPELTTCRTLMPEDAVHSFSVFEHTLRVLRNIESFPPDSFYGRLRDSLPSVSSLYLAALLHDVGKAISDKPHSIAGAEIAKAVVARWQLGTGVGETIEWLVREHLTFARFIGMRDVSEPKTAAEFAEVVADRERLDMLAVLTCADVQAVAPNAWTPAQDAFLRELHGRTAAIFETQQPLPQDPAVYRRRLLRTLRDHPAPDAEIEAFLERLPAQYAISTPADLVPVHMELVRKAEAGEIGVVWDHDRERNLSEVTACAPDAPGLLSRILGVLYAFDLSVHGLRANTTEGPRVEGRGSGETTSDERRTTSENPHSKESPIDNPPQAQDQSLIGSPTHLHISTPPHIRVALDTVLVSFAQQPAPQATCSLAGKALEDVLLRRASLAELLRAHGKDPERKQEHFNYNFVEGSPGILEFQAPRGRGMAFRLAKMIYAQGWNIVSARFGQWAGKGAAAFYVLDERGQGLTKARVDEAIRDRA